MDFDLPLLKDNYDMMVNAHANATSPEDPQHVMMSHGGGTIDIKKTFGHRSLEAGVPAQCGVGKLVTSLEIHATQMIAVTNNVNSCDFNGGK